MNKKDVLEIVIREMTEIALLDGKKTSPNMQELYNKVNDLNKRMQEKTLHLSDDIKNVITEYIETTALVADHDCMYLYVQGAKDCVELLKKLGVL